MSPTLLACPTQNMLIRESRQIAKKTYTYSVIRKKSNISLLALRLDHSEPVLAEAPGDCRHICASRGTKLRTLLISINPPCHLPGSARRINPFFCIL